MTSSRAVIGVASSPSAKETANRVAARDLAVPLAIDIDGTLVRSNLLLESVVLLLKRRPFDLVKLPLWLSQGRAQLKHRLAAVAMPDVHTLPYNTALIDYLIEQKRHGRSLVLATAADEAVACEIAQELGFFDSVYASDGTTNLRGERKRARLVAEFGWKGFDYAGDSARDRAVWRGARKAIIVGRPSMLGDTVAQRETIERVFPKPSFGIHELSRALRVHHWFKNALVFLPLVAAHRLYDAISVSHALVAFVTFCLCASSVYLLNDLLDLPDDRLHPHKRERMLASGRMSIGFAMALLPLLLILAAIVSFAQSGALSGVIGTYWLLMLAYCIRLRDILVLDVMTLAGGYTLRVMAGAASGGLVIPASLLVLCILFFFGLALLKRYAELVALRSFGRSKARAYVARHAGLVALVGCGSGYVAIVGLAYQLGVHYRMDGRYGFIWFVFPLLLYWLAHIWAMARRGYIVADPVTFALADRSSRIVAALAAATVILSS